MASLVALAMAGGPLFVQELQRAWDGGNAVLPIDPRLPEPGVRRLLATLRPAAMVGADGLRQRLSGGVGVEPGDALVMVTSGTTGDAKGCVLTHAAVAASAWATTERLKVDPGVDRWLACLPLSHVGGLSVVTRALTTGTPLSVHPDFSADAVGSAARTEGVTMVSLVATALARLDAGIFRTVVLGGSAPPADLPPNVVTTYGLTETGSGVVYDGWPLDGVEIEVVPPAPGAGPGPGRGAAVVPGGDGAREGQIHIRGLMLARAYRQCGAPTGGHDPNLDEDPTSPDGWLATGDWGALSTTGRLSVLGRLSDLVITGGENVWPAAVERTLLHLPGVAAVAVGGRPDPEWGQRVVAWVVPANPSDPPTLDSLRARVAEDLPRFAAPRELVLVDSLPRTGLGKIARHQLT